MDALHWTEFHNSRRRGSSTATTSARASRWLLRDSHPVDFSAVKVGLGGVQLVGKPQISLRHMPAARLRTSSADLLQVRGKVC